jgi:hypothetical protein
VAQGGYLTETALSFLGRLAGAAPAGTSNLYGFSLRWPPAVPTGHSESLSLLDPAQLVFLLFELGPALALAPLATRWAWKAARCGDLLLAGTGLSAALMMLFTLLFDYGLSRSGVRMPNTTLWLWVMLGIPLAARAWSRLRPWSRALAGAGYAVLVMGGLITFGLQIASAPQPVAAPFISELDIPMSRAYWNRLEPGALVFDTIPERSVTLFGQATRAKRDVYSFMPEWEALAVDPNPQKVAAAGYTYIYLDDLAQRAMSDATLQAYRRPCVKVVKEVLPTAGYTFRRLLDVRACR